MSQTPVFPSPIDLKWMNEQRIFQRMTDKLLYLNIFRGTAHRLSKILNDAVDMSTGSKEDNPPPQTTQPDVLNVTDMLILNVHRLIDGATGDVRIIENLLSRPLDELSENKATFPKEGLTTRIRDAENLKSKVNERFFDIFFAFININNKLLKDKIPFTLKPEISKFLGEPDNFLQEKELELLREKRDMLRRAGFLLKFILQRLMVSLSEGCQGCSSRSNYSDEWSQVFCHPRSSSYNSFFSSDELKSMYPGSWPSSSGERMSMSKSMSHLESSIFMLASIKPSVSSGFPNLSGNMSSLFSSRMSAVSMGSDFFKPSHMESSFSPSDSLSAVSGMSGFSTKVPPLSSVSPHSRLSGVSRFRSLSMSESTVKSSHYPEDSVLFPRSSDNIPREKLCLQMIVNSSDLEPPQPTPGEPEHQLLPLTDLFLFHVRNLIYSSGQDRQHLWEELNVHGERLYEESFQHLSYDYISKKRTDLRRKLQDLQKTEKKIWRMYEEHSKKVHKKGQDGLTNREIHFPSQPIYWTKAP